jgi:hypothetical protein
MNDRETVIKQTVEFLKSIKTLDDVKEHKKEIFDVVLGMFKSALVIVKSFFETSKSMSTEEKAKEFSKFQDDSFLMPPEIEEEMDRINDISGADEILDEFQQKLEEQMEPIVEEISQHMSKLAEEFFGDMLGGMAEGITQGFGEMFGGEEGDQNMSSEPGDNEKLDVGQIIYNIQSFEDLKNNEDRIIEQIEDQLKADLYVLEYHKKMDIPPDQLMQKGYMGIE